MRKLFILSMILTFLISTTSAATLNVGPGAVYCTIQSAIDAAHDGDTIQIASGIYNETILVTDKQLNISGIASKLTVRDLYNRELHIIICTPEDALNLLSQLI